MAAQLWLLEGLPGTGKTSAAKRLAAMCDEARLPARWWPEEAKDHPATPAAVRSRSAEPDFADQCVSSFVALLRREDGVLILEGSVFQSTVRFMFANGWNRERIGAYLGAWSAAVEPGRPRLVMLRADDVAEHFHQIIAVRGQSWIERLVGYVERTAVAQANGWRGLAGFVCFWAAYQRLILGIAADLKCPVLELRGWCERRSFPVDEAFAFLSR